MCCPSCSPIGLLITALPNSDYNTLRRSHLERNRSAIVLLYMVLLLSSSLLSVVYRLMHIVASGSNFPGGSDVNMEKEHVICYPARQRGRQHTHMNTRTRMVQRVQKNSSDEILHPVYGIRPRFCQPP
jgi:hypothetical protein